MCAKLRPLKPRKSQYDRGVVKYQLKKAKENGIPAMTENTLQSDYPHIYKELKTHRS
ncbi:MAG TPA: hypothetical protein VE521_04540 [Nitrososphaera sp.]|jgi:hypothetical protein|nr:hypothetical protein [Nitrososphaera sp.]